jgi:hypothetical protein
MKKVPIKCNETNIIYSSAIEVSKAMNLNVKSISKVLNGKLKKTGGYTFSMVQNAPSNIVQEENNAPSENAPCTIKDSAIIHSAKEDNAPSEIVQNAPSNKIADTHSNSDSNNDSEQFNDTTFYKNLVYQLINDFNTYRDNKIYPLIEKSKEIQEENTKLKEQRNKIITSVADDTTVSELKEIIESQQKEIEKLNNEYDLLMDSQGNGDFLKKKYRQQRDENKKMVQELISMKYIVEKAKDEVQEAIWGDFTQLEHEDLIKENLEMKKILAKYEDVTEFKTLNYMNLSKENNAIVAPSADMAETDIDKALDDIANDKESDLIKDVKNIDSATLRRPNNEDNEIQEMAWSDI